MNTENLNEIPFFHMFQRSFLITFLHLGISTREILWEITKAFKSSS